MESNNRLIRDDNVPPAFPTPTPTPIQEKENNPVSPVASRQTTPSSSPIEKKESKQSGQYKDDTEDALIKELKAVSDTHDRESAAEQKIFPIALYQKGIEEKNAKTLFQFAQIAIQNKSVDWLAVLLGPCLFTCRQSYEQAIRDKQIVWKKTAHKKMIYDEVKNAVDEYFSAVEQMQQTEICFKKYNGQSLFSDAGIRVALALTSREIERLEKRLAILTEEQEKKSGEYKNQEKKELETKIATLKMQKQSATDTVMKFEMIWEKHQSLERKEIEDRQGISYYRQGMGNLSSEEYKEYTRSGIPKINPLILEQKETVSIIYRLTERFKSIIFQLEAKVEKEWGEETGKLFGEYKREFNDEQFEQRYGQPLLKLYLSCIDEIKKDFLSKLNGLNEKTSKFLATGNFSEWKRGLGLDKICSDLNIESQRCGLEKTKLDSEYKIKRTERKDIFTKQAKEWLTSHLSVLPVEYTHHRNVDALIAQSIDTAEWSFYSNPGHHLYPSVAALLEEKTNNTLFHKLMAVYACTLIKSHSEQATEDDQTDLTTLRHMAILLHQHGCSPYQRNYSASEDKRGQTAYEYGNAEGAAFYRMHTPKLKLKKDIEKCTLPDWPLIQYGLQYTPTYSELSGKVKQVLLQYSRETQNQLNNFFLRLFMNLTIKEVYRAREVGDLMEHLHEAKKELSDEILTNRIEELMRIAERGLLGQTTLFTALRRVLNNGALQKLPFPVSEILQRNMQNAIKETQEKMLVQQKLAAEKEAKLRHQIDLQEKTAAEREKEMQKKLDQQTKKSQKDKEEAVTQERLKAQQELEDKLAQQRQQVTQQVTRQVTQEIEAKLSPLYTALSQFSPQLASILTNANLLPAVIAEKKNEKEEKKDEVKATPLQSMNPVNSLVSLSTHGPGLFRASGDNKNEASTRQSASTSNPAVVQSSVITDSGSGRIGEDVVHQALTH